MGYWHFAHSYVRGNWAETETSAPSLLTKCCHDVDILMWLLCSPHYGDLSAGNAEGELVPKPTHARVPGMGVRRNPHLPTRITSTGALVHFRRKNKPVKAGDATNCFDCPAELECMKPYLCTIVQTNAAQASTPPKKSTSETMGSALAGQTKLSVLTSKTSPSPPTMKKFKPCSPLP